MSRVLSGAVLLFGIMLVPGVAHGQVVISEIAWMGTDVPTNAHYCEWIELENEGGEEVSLSGWRLATADGGMSVTLTGSIAPGAFFVIERYTANACPDPVPGTNDQSVPFGSGLANAGEILILSASGTEVDRVDASEGWEESVGGDADEKYTAQRAGTGWVTAVPTPGTENATVSASTEESGTTSTTSSSASKTASNPVPYLIIDPGTDRTVSTHAHTRYRALAYDSKSKLREHAHITWAFGDGDRAVGREAEHRYEAPGEYLVVVRAQDRYSHGTKSFTVLVDDARVTIEAASASGIVLTNTHTRIVDLSRWILEAGEETYRLPEDTAMLPGRSVLFPASVTGLEATEQVRLLYPDGTQAAVLATTTQPTAPDSGSLLLKEVEPLAGNRIPFSHDASLDAPPAAVDPAAGGARSISNGPDWLESRGYRRLSLHS